MTFTRRLKVRFRAPPLLRQVTGCRFIRTLYSKFSMRLILRHVRALKMSTGASSDIKRRCFSETFSYKFSRLVLRQAICSTVFICHCASLKMWLGLPAASVVLPYHRNVNPTFINNNDGLFRIAAISWINSFTPTVCLSRSVLVFTLE